VPVDLGLSEVGGGFAPATPVVGIQIPKWPAPVLVDTG
jgi:hypothetical protein